MRKEAEKLNIALPEGAEALFERYTTLLLQYNDVMNLTAITDTEEIKIKHYLDSISPLGFGLLEENSKVADVGSGAGFPGVPIKIARPDLDMTLIDSLGKRINFLEKVKEELALTSVKCVNLRAEDAGREKSLRESFDAVFSRAVAPMQILSEYCLPLLKTGGKFFALKGPMPQEELDASKKAIEVLGGQILDVKKVSLPGEITHTIVIVEKIAPTPDKYPRRAGKPSKNPIE